MSHIKNSLSSIKSVFNSAATSKPQSITSVFNKAAATDRPVTPPVAAPKMALEMGGAVGHAVRQNVLQEWYARSAQSLNRSAGQSMPPAQPAKDVIQKFYEAAGIKQLSGEDKAGRQAQEIGKLKEKFNDLSLSR